MKKILAFICVSMMAIVFVSFLTSAEAADTSDLNGKWKGTVAWQNGFEDLSMPHIVEIVQKNAEITMIRNPTSKLVGTLKGNIIYFEPSVIYDPRNGSKLDYPAREYKISEDGKNMSSNFRYQWKSLDGNGGVGTMKIIIVRE
jgi:hypothetical protein